MSDYNELKEVVYNIVDIILEDLHFNGVIEEDDKYRMHNALSYYAFSEVYDCLADLEEIAQENGDETGYEDGYSDGYSEGYSEGYEDALKEIKEQRK